MLIKNMTKDDYNHIWWLFKTGLKCALQGNFKDAIEATYWIRIHLSYKSKKVK